MIFNKKRYIVYISENLVLMFPLTIQDGTTMIIYDVEDDI